MGTAFEIMGIIKCKSDVSCRPRPRIFPLRGGSSVAPKGGKYSVCSPTALGRHIHWRTTHHLCHSPWGGRVHFKAWPKLGRDSCPNCLELPQATVSHPWKLPTLRDLQSNDGYAAIRLPIHSQINFSRCYFTLCWRNLFTKCPGTCQVGRVHVPGSWRLLLAFLVLAALTWNGGTC